MNEFNPLPALEVTFSPDGCVLTPENLAEMLRTIETYRFVRVDDQIWIRDENLGNHIELVTQVAGLSKEELTRRVKDAGFMQTFGTDDYLRVVDWSTSLEEYISKEAQQANRTATTDLIHEMDTNLKIR